MQLLSNVWDAANLFTCFLFWTSGAFSGAGVVLIVFTLYDHKDTSHE